MNMDLKALLEPVRQIASEAGERIMEIYETAFTVESKDDNSPLTAADLTSHQTIVAALQRLTPDIPVLSEESASIPFAQRRGWERFWLVDPLDGTKEFVKRNGEFTVNIALVEDHRPVLGVVSVPAQGVCYLAARNLGAFRQEGEGAPQPIRVRVRSNSPVQVVGSRSHPGPDLAAFVEALGAHELVSVGSSLKLCLVAEGSADIYPRLGPTCEWDTAAAQCVVECAGGRVVDTRGQPLTCNTGESLLNPHFLVIGPSDRDWLGYLLR